MNKTKNIKVRIDQCLDNFCRKNFEYFPHLKEALFPGRRSRPILFYSLLSKAPTKDVDRIGMAIEFSHRASIILDDLIDNDILRRREKTFHSLFGKTTTILVSHFLISSSFNILNEVTLINKENINSAFYDAGKKMILGEMADIGAVNKFDLDTYLQKLLLKTSSLYELAAKCAALVNQENDLQVSLYSKIGDKIGRLYQMLNDLYDDSEAHIYERGEKKTWSFNLTLLKAIAYEYGDPNTKELLSDYFQRSVLSEDDFVEATRFFKTEKYLKIAKENIYYQIHELTLLLKQLTNIEAKNIFNKMLNEMKESKYHNHYEFTEAGY